MPDLTPEQIERLKARLAKATPPPWQKGQGSRGGPVIERDPETEASVVSGYAYPGWGLNVRHEDLALIVEAVNALPALLAAVERLKEVEKLYGFAVDAIAGFKAEIEVWMDDLHKARSERDALHEANRSLQAKVLNLLESEGDADVWLDFVGEEGADTDWTPPLIAELRAALAEAEK